MPSAYSGSRRSHRYAGVVTGLHSHGRRCWPTAGSRPSWRRARKEQGCTGDSASSMWASSGSGAARRSGSSLDRDEVLFLGTALDHDRAHVANALDVVLVLDDPTLERRPLACLQGVFEPAVRNRDRLAPAEDRRHILGVARVVLLAIDVPDARIGFHHDAGLRAFDSGLPRPVAANPLAVDEVRRVLAEVPDVPMLVLRVPVEGLLLTLAPDQYLIEDDGRTDAEDHLRLVRDEDGNPARLSFLGPAEEEGRARSEREVLVVDPADEVARWRKDGDRGADLPRTARARENEDAEDCSYEDELPAHACLLFRWQTVGSADEIAVKAVVERFVCLMEDPAP